MQDNRQTLREETAVVRNEQELRELHWTVRPIPVQSRDAEEDLGIPVMG